MAETKEKVETKVMGTESQDSRLIATLSYLGILSVVFYVLKREDSYVAFHAKQGMVLTVGMMLGGIAFITVIGPLLGFVCFLASIYGAVKAYSGEKYRLPVVADLSDKINF